MVESILEDLVLNLRPLSSVARIYKMHTQMNALGRVARSKEPFQGVTGPGKAILEQDVHFKSQARLGEKVFLLFRVSEFHDLHGEVLKLGAVNGGEEFD